MNIWSLLFGVMVFSFHQPSSDTPSEPIKAKSGKPCVSFTFDDGITSPQAHYEFETWNQMLLQTMEEAGIQSVFFVTGANKLDEKGKFLLNSWAAAGHSLANHSYTHPNFSQDKLTAQDFEMELQQTDQVIAAYPTYVKLFRFPYLKEGKSADKIAQIRAVLAKHGYRNGYVTIDASDWFVNAQLLKSLQKNGPNDPNIEKYRDFYVKHILDRANYYENLAHQLTNRHIKHTLLLHHNLTSALFLDDLIQAFKQAGWEITDAQEAFQDDIFKQLPTTVPAGESLIWSLAKQTGQYEAQLRYPAEDSRYELEAMKSLGLYQE
ncbi:MAG: polysaccharide deacetylase family protein [Chitinophagales bacterium]|nr:polysaccharide deacetylase family protein [Chitinophagales bacterium]